MKIHYLGTGASQGIPMPICDCRVCEEARKRGGKDVRARAGYLIDEDMMIDFSPDFLHNVITHRIDFKKVSTLLITHTHNDHFYPYDLGERERYVRRYGAIEMSIYGNEKMKEILEDVPFETIKYEHMPIRALRSGDTVQIGRYTVSAIAIQHISTEECLAYVITKDGKSYLHGGDSSIFDESVYEALKKLNVRLDAVSLDCTCGDMEKGYFGHMTIWEGVEVRRRLQALGIADENTKFVLTHVADCCGKTFDELDEVAKREGFILSYDGMILEI